MTGPGGRMHGMNNTYVPVFRDWFGRDDRQADLERTVRTLATMLHDEYPDALSLVEIAATWGEGLSQADLDAVATVEARVLKSP